MQFKHILHKETHTNKPVEEKVPNWQQGYVSCGCEDLVVFEPGNLSCWSAVWRSAGDCNVLASLHCQVFGLLLKTPVHLW